MTTKTPGVRTPLADVVAIMAASLTRFLSQRAQARQPSPIRALIPLTRLPGMISLGGGLPNPETFPLSSFEFGLKTGERISLSTAEVNEALQYGPTPGQPVLVDRLRALQQRTHKPRYEDWDVAVTTGSQEAFCRAIDAVLNPGDSLLVEDPSYPGALAFLKTQQVNFMPVKIDSHGLVPDSLEEVLGRAKADQASGRSSVRPPRVLYTIPTGQNPSGATMSADRREKLIQICQENDILILEDDPYAFLHYGRTQDLRTDPQELALTPVDAPPDSLFSLDTEGRVLRFDSFSKVLSSGLRVGWVTGHKDLLRPISLQGEVTNLHTSALSQLVVAKLLEHWGEAGWDKHVEFIGQQYLRRRNIFLKAADTHLQGLAEWSVPSAGMFCWLRLAGVDDSDPVIKGRAAEEKVLMVPGQSCSPLNEKSAFCRASFSTASEEQINIALERFAKVLRNL